MSSKNYVELAKKRELANLNNISNSNNMPHYTFRNESQGRGNAYQVENEYEEVEVKNNLKNIQRISSNNMKTQSKENYTMMANQLKSLQKNDNLETGGNVGSISTIYPEEKISAQSYNLYPIKKQTDDTGMKITSYIEANSKLNSSSLVSNSLQHSPLTHRLVPTNKTSLNKVNLSNYVTTSGNNKMTIKNYIFGNQQDLNNTAAHINNFQMNSSAVGTPQRVNRSFDYMKPPIKKGMFSYPKSSGNVINNYVPINSNYEKYTANNKLLNSGHQLNLVPSGGNIIDVSSSNISIPNSIDKYQIIKSMNANITNRSVNLVDESDSISTLKKNDSSSSINFNKYKVGLGISTVLNNTNPTGADLTNTTNLFGINSQSEVTSLWKNNLEGVNDSSPNFNMQKQMSLLSNKNGGNNIQTNTLQTNMLKSLSNNNLAQGFGSNNNNNSQLQTINSQAQQPLNTSQINKDKYHTFSGDNNQKLTGNNTPNTSSKAQLVPNNDTSAKHPPLRNKNPGSGIIFKYKQRHEKESRRMLIEMVKLKSKRKGQNIDKVIKDMQINETILLLNRSEIPANLLLNMNNNIINKFSNTTNEVFNQVSGSLEIKNNNFEINNNYFATVNSFKKTDAKMVSKTIPQFIYNMDEESQEKVDLICYLVTPRLLHMSIGSINNSNNQKIPFIFQLSPTNLCFEYGLEHYIFQWSELNSISPVGSIDILKIASCSKNSSQDNVFIIETSKEKSLSTGQTSLNLYSENNRYEIIATNSEECKLYVNALNYLSQLVKCKAYSFKGNSKIKS